MEVGDKMQNFSTIPPKLCLIGQKNTGTSGVNTTIKTFSVNKKTLGSENLASSENILIEENFVTEQI